MTESASIAQEFYKIREYWRSIDKQPGWKLMIWLAEYQDVDILDKFMETERSPVGVFDDIFFRFDSIYSGEDKEFVKELWQEFRAWFMPAPQEKHDIIKALKNDGLLLEDYTPPEGIEESIDRLWQEMLAFKKCIKDLDNTNFCIYFPPSLPTGPKMGEWFNNVLDRVPKGIRLATIDYVHSRKVDLGAKATTGKVKELQPKLKMLTAISNEMDKGSGNSDTTSTDARFTKQIRVVLDVTLKKDSDLLSKEVETLFMLSKKMGGASHVLSGYMVAAQAYYMIVDFKTSEAYADEAVSRAEVLMEKDKSTGYHLWKTCVMLKGAILVARKKRKEGIILYDGLAKTAAAHEDPYTAMEGNRFSGQLYYELDKLSLAFETLLLGLVCGSYLDREMIRQSTFMQIAALAMYIGKQIKNTKEMAVLEAQLALWIGDDWQELLQSDHLEKVTVRRKKTLFETT
jgi:hypothetical protein